MQLFAHLCSTSTASNIVLGALLMPETNKRSVRYHHAHISVFQFCLLYLTYNIRFTKYEILQH